MPGEVVVCGDERRKMLVPCPPSCPNYDICKKASGELNITPGEIINTNRALVSPDPQGDRRKVAEVAKDIVVHATKIEAKDQEKSEEQFSNDCQINQQLAQP